MDDNPQLSGCARDMIIRCETLEEAAMRHPLASIRDAAHLMPLALFKKAALSFPQAAIKFAPELIDATFMIELEEAMLNQENEVEEIEEEDICRNEQFQLFLPM